MAKLTFIVKRKIFFDFFSKKKKRKKKSIKSFESHLGRPSEFRSEHF